MGNALGKRLTTSLVARDDFDPAKPCNWILGWTPAANDYGGYWEKARRKLITHAQGARIIEEGLPPYTKFMVVTPKELSVIGMPPDYNAREFFTLSRQREVSLRNNSGKRRKSYNEVLDQITDPEGE